MRAERSLSAARGWHPHRTLLRVTTIRLRVRRSAAVLVAIVLTAGLAGCAPDSDAIPGPAGIRVSVPPDRCPPSVEAVRSVVATNRDRSTLLPPSLHVGSALVCEYTSSLAKAGDRSRLRRRILLDHDEARALVAAVRAVHIVNTDDPVSCPDDRGTATVLSFAPSGRSPAADLWWHDSGCQTLDDGAVRTQQLENPFFGGFQSAFRRVTTAR